MAQKSTSKRIHLIYDVPNWAYHSYTSALVKYAPPDLKITHSARLPKDLEKYSLVVVLPFQHAQKYYGKARMLGIPVVINLYIQLPHLNELFRKAYKCCDYVIFNNLISYKFFGEQRNTVYIPNGVDLKQFYDAKKPRRDVALICSSEFFKILKGIEIAKYIPDVETLVTDSRRPVKNKQEMCDWYNTAKVYLCLSEYEGTPNPALEAAACGCVVVSTPVGNMPELIEHGYNGFLLANRDPELVHHLIRNAIFGYESYSKNMLSTIQEWDWAVHSQAYYQYFRQMAQT